MVQVRRLVLNGPKSYFTSVFPSLREGLFIATAQMVVVTVIVNVWIQTKVYPMMIKGVLPKSRVLPLSGSVIPNAAAQWNALIG